MARRPKKMEAESELRAEVRSGDTKVKSYVVPARRLVTLYPDHPIWAGVENIESIGPKATWKGAIVRLRPPHDVADGLVETLKVILSAVGVARIKLEVRRGVVLPTEAVDKGKPTRSTAREVVLQLVAEANSSDAAALLEVVEKVMAEEGL